MSQTVNILSVVFNAVIAIYAPFFSTLAYLPHLLLLCSSDFFVSLSLFSLYISQYLFVSASLWPDLLNNLLHNFVFVNQKV